ncbi:MAG: DNA polymerase/3'-5' exonuclease PolX [Nitrococcus mobilis]|nr:DNA polymerase/3'-5' exonuclease PolX [Nitrococcus mobilis]
MALSNTEIASFFEKLADLLEIQDANPFRIRAYRNAARVIAGYPHSVADQAAAGADLNELPGIGSAIAEKIHTLVDTGRLPALDEAAKTTPSTLTELMELPGLGPKRVKQLYQELGIKSTAELAQAAREDRLASLEGFGAKLQAQLLETLRQRADRQRRTRLDVAEDRARPLLKHFAAVRGVRQVIVAGSYRRRQETVGDLDILVNCRRDTPVMEALRAFPGIESVASQGETRATVFLSGGLQVDVRVIAESAFGAALHYFTGSKAHNVAIRRMAVAACLKLNEYGVFRDGQQVAGRTEEEIFAAIDLPWIPPELRENTGEIEAARHTCLPQLIRVEDLRGDLHSHTVATDGHATLAAMAEAARTRGYQYLAITDHSQQVRVAGGLDPERLSRHIDAIKRYNETEPGIRVLASCEVDILEDGRLDVPNALLQRLDVVVAAVHSQLRLPRRRQMDRLRRAMDHPRVHILAHPTGRLIGERDPIDIDLEQLLIAARERGVCMEINAQPARLDLKDNHCRLAKEMGVRLVISSDAHSTTDLAKIRFGIDQARRGWIEPQDVLNTRPLSQFLQALQR